MIYETDPHGIDLRLSAQRALWDNVPPTLRAVSIELRDRVIHFRAVFEPGVSDGDRELLSEAAAEVIADFPEPFDIVEEFLEVPVTLRPEHLQYLVFLRAERRPE